ncbi:hypothetical protein ACS0TY_032934 [Phlomoides rotata]
MSRNLRRVPSLLHTLCRRNVYYNPRSLYIGAAHPPPLLRGCSTDWRVFNPTPPPTINPIATSASFTSSTESHTAEHDLESDFDDEVVGRSAGDLGSSRDSELIMDILQTPGAQAKSDLLEQCGVKVTPEIVAGVLSRTRNDWETAFTFFLWANKQPGYKHTVREYHSMIAILGKFRKFDTAWNLIDEMKAASLVTPQTLLIMIRKYAAVHDVAKAINAFYGHRKFKFEIGIEEFQSLLAALCRYKNVKDAEHLLFCNKDVFPLNTKSFNIILNGWCNVMGELLEGKRMWREMEKRGIKHDVYSYSSIISCHSKFNHLNMVLRFYEKMKSLGIKPDRKVYNAVIYALAKRRLVKEARGLMKAMEEEDCTPDAVTYNSLIMPLCKSNLLDDAKQVFDEMTQRGLHPTVRTYHGFFRVLRTPGEVFDLLHRMHTTRCHPNQDTYIMLIRKFCRWREFESVYKLWGEMSKNPDRSSYIVLIHGLFLNGRLEEAHKYYLEMKEKDFLPEPKIDAMLKEWIASKDSRTTTSIEVGEKERVRSRKNHREGDFRRQPELRSVTRDQGFSFVDR